MSTYLSSHSVGREREIIRTTTKTMIEILVLRQDETGIVMSIHWRNIVAILMSAVLWRTNIFVCLTVASQRHCRHAFPIDHCRARGESKAWTTTKPVVELDVMQVFKQSAWCRWSLSSDSVFRRRKKPSSSRLSCPSGSPVNSNSSSRCFSMFIFLSLAFSFSHLHLCQSIFRLTWLD